MSRNVIVIAESSTEQEQLAAVLTKEYAPLYAQSGEEGLALLASSRSVCAILLDLGTPPEDGLTALRRIRENARFQQIPLIAAVDGAEKDALSKALVLGANFCIEKPYAPAILKQLVENTVRMCEIAAATAAQQRDNLTGLYNREAFFVEAGQMIAAHEPGYYILACFDIDSFKVINDQYGTEKGDCVLRHAAVCLDTCASHIGGICCRFMADKFGLLYPAQYKDSDQIIETHKKIIQAGFINRNVRVRIGRYLVTDTTLSVGSMFDRTILASESIKGRYDTYISQYSEAMRDDLLYEQQIVNAMEQALAKDEFEVWFQPQYNHATGALIGSEALVRWCRDGKLVPPNDFIPIFERNGFIYELDQYIWRRVCMLLRRGIDEGKNPLPVSVNISRHDVFQKGFFEIITGLVKEYSIPLDLLRLEVTESAFAESTKTIIRIVNELIKFGFTVEIDDFGSGYSSLNTLKDVPASILKLDMKFLEDTNDSRRGGNILESVVRMARWLGMAVIAEGVESVQQADYLKSIGCDYVQGHLYGMSMSYDDYEKLCEAAKKELKLTHLKTVDTWDNSAFWDPKSMETLIFNSYVGGACIFEYCGGKPELLRYNERYRQLFPGEFVSGRVSMGQDPFSHMDEENRKALYDNIENAIKTQKESTCEVCAAGQKGALCYLRTTVRMIARTMDRQLFYCVVADISEQRMAEQKRRDAEKKEMESAQLLQVIMENINGGVTAAVLNEGNDLRVMFANDGFYTMHGYTREQFNAELPSALDAVYAEDRERVQGIVSKLVQERGSITYEYRCTKRDGSIIWIQCSNSVISLSGVGDTVLLAVTSDITKLRNEQDKESEAADKLGIVLNHVGSGITAVMVDDTGGEFLFANDKYYEIMGYTREEYREQVQDNYLIVHPEDRKRVREAVMGADRTGGPITVTYRIIRPDGAMLWIKTVISMCKFPNMDKPVQLAIFSDMTAERETEEQLRFLNNSAHDILGQPDSDKAVNETLQKLREYFAGDRAYIVELDYARGISNNTYEICAEGVPCEMERLKDMPFSDTDFWLKTLRKNELVIIADAAGLENRKAELHGMLTEQGIRMLILAPLWREGQLIGFVGVDNPTKATNQVDGLMALGDYLAMLLMRRDLSSAVRRSDDAMQMLMKDTPGGFCRMAIRPDKMPGLLYINEGLCEMLGMTQAEVMQTYSENACGCLCNEDLADCQKDSREAQAEGGQFTTRCRLRRADGSLFWVMVFGRFSRTDAGDFCLNCYFTDITRQKEEEDQQKKLLDNLPCGAALYEYNGRDLSVIHINKRYWKLVGRDSVDYSSASVFGAIHPEDVQTMRQELEAAIRQKRNVECDVRILTGDGGYRPFHIVANVIPGQQGIYSCYTFYMPITDQAMSVQEMLPIALSTMMSSSDDLSYVKDKDLRYICCSHSVAEMLGVENERELIGKCAYDLFSGDIAESFSRQEREVLNSGRAMVNHIEMFPGEDGSLRYSKASRYPLLDPAGNVIGLYGISQDITKMRENEFQLKLLTESIPGGLVSISFGPERTRLLYFNEGFYSFTGYTREEYLRITEKDALALVPEADKKKIREMAKQLNAGRDHNEIRECTYRCCTKDGGIRWFNLKGKIAESSGDGFVLNAVQYDITEQREAQEKLRVSEEENRLAIAHSGSIITKFDVRRRTLTLPASINSIFELPQVLKNVPAEQIALGRISPETADVYTELFESIVRGNVSGAATFQQKSAKGWRWLKAQYTTVFSSSGRPVSAVITFADITEQLEKEVVYNKWQQSLDERADDSYTLFRCNLSKGSSFDSREGTLLKADFSEENTTFDGFTAEYAQKCVYKEDQERYLAFLNSDTMLASYYRGHRSHTLEYRQQESDGEVRWLRLSTDLVEYPNSKDIEVYLMYENIDEQKKEELRVLEQAQTDPLTGVLNRATFISGVEQLLTAAKPGEKHALFMLDVDEFKRINDTMGHSAGDRILQELTHSITSVLRHDDLIGRLGGDEFLVLIKDIPDENAAATKAGQICSLKLGTLDNGDTVTTSIGIAMIPRDGNDFETLYQKADDALYQKKRSGKAGYLFYSGEDAE